MPERYSTITAKAVKQARASIAVTIFGTSLGRRIAAARAKKTP